MVDTSASIVLSDGECITVTTEEHYAEYLVLAGEPVNHPWVKLLGFNGGLIGGDREEVEMKMAEYEKLKSAERIGHLSIKYYPSTCRN